jgi:hypothetical protein
VLAVLLLLLRLLLRVVVVAVAAAMVMLLLLPAAVRVMVPAMALVALVAAKVAVVAMLLLLLVPEGLGLLAMLLSLQGASMHALSWWHHTGLVRGNLLLQTCASLLLTVHGKAVSQCTPLHQSRQPSQMNYIAMLCTRVACCTCPQQSHQQACLNQQAPHLCLPPRLLLLEAVQRLEGALQQLPQLWQATTTPQQAQHTW